jgi:hypothetical protein
MSGAAGIPAIHGGEEVNYSQRIDIPPRGPGLDRVVPRVAERTRWPIGEDLRPILRAEVLVVEQVSITQVG